MATRKSRSGPARRTKVPPARRYDANWEPPADYQPRPGLGAYLTSISPPLNTAEFDMVVYWQWRFRTVWKRTADQAWQDLKMTPAHAQVGIAHRIVPLEIYPRAVARAQETRRRALRRALPDAGASLQPGRANRAAARTSRPLRRKAR